MKFSDLRFTNIALPTFLLILTLAAVTLSCALFPISAEQPTPTTAVLTTPTAEIVATASPEQIEAFRAELMQALEERHFDRLQSMMDQIFGMSGWHAQGAFYSAERAVELLQKGYFEEEDTLVFGTESDLREMLGGQDPTAIFTEEVKIVDTFLVKSWGMDGYDEMILYIAQRPDGSLYWHSLLYAPGGFMQG